MVVRLVSFNTGHRVRLRSIRSWLGPRCAALQHRVRLLGSCCRELLVSSFSQSDLDRKSSGTPRFLVTHARRWSFLTTALTVSYKLYVHSQVENDAAECDATNGLQVLGKSLPVIDGWRMAYRVQRELAEPEDNSRETECASPASNGKIAHKAFSIDRAEKTKPD